jgi:hypothetical protein
MTFKPLTVGKLITMLEQYEPESLVKVYDETCFDLMFIDKIATKVDPDNKHPDVIFEVKEN